ncbi:alpha-amylase family glycosyl hydrolase [Prevotella sp. E9-3]|uniref:alpha-amylase family glycosyl hydrolase n=1 Tax=Prevotella sp. E9-3 TaxID=2913621 RepID=UPI001EDBEF30|nr:alpha-amylase family glycosyl hydrolase [Prevotella sp. E9-3]UKK48992.1 alpha-amylase family glycosyl hydrolase [Prevotella sp. E9-3]
MKKIYSLIATLFIVLSSHAQWPANYDGVMLQGFYWNSFEDTQWTKLTSQVDELSTYFNAIWVPNSAWCTDGNSMGYDPVYWFRHKSSFGQHRELTEMIKAFKEKNVSIIEDVVLNHKKPQGKKVMKDGKQVSSWIDFVEESPTIEGQKYEIKWSGADICKNDDGGYTASQGWEVTGNNDTGDDFSGFRDLDHTSANVQNNIKLYLRYLLKNLGYDGFRLDMVKGYSGYYTKLYNEAVQPKFCVGEYWDGFDAITNWINATGKTSAAFDFPFKYQLNEACKGNWGALSNKGLAGSPDWSRYSVTFVDNHDTYENESRLTGSVLAANAIILAMPGTPCIFLKHWQSYPIAIGNMILARKACGLTNQSNITEQKAVSGGYVIKTQGSKGTVLVLCGRPSYDTNGFKQIATGENFAYYVSNNINVEGLRPGTDNPYKGEIPTCVKPIEGHIYFYFQANKDFPTPYAWVWGMNEINFNTVKTWPGDAMTKVGQDSDMHDIYLWDGGEAGANMPTGIVVSNNGGKQTADFVFYNGGYYDASGYLTTPTAIEAVKSDKHSTSAKTYTLTGQQANANYRGIVIKNGKKIISK